MMGRTTKRCCNSTWTTKPSACPGVGDNHPGAMERQKVGLLDDCSGNNIFEHGCFARPRRPVDGKDATVVRWLAHHRVQIKLSRRHDWVLGRQGARRQLRQTSPSVLGRGSLASISRLRSRNRSCGNVRLPGQPVSLFYHRAAPNESGSWELSSSSNSFDFRSFNPRNVSTNVFRHRPVVLLFRFISCQG